MKKLREEEGVELADEDNDEAGWEGWDVESDSSEESSDGWIDVESDGDEDLEISDSEDEGPSKEKIAEQSNAEDDVPDITRVSTLATTKVCIHVIAPQFILSPLFAPDSNARGFCSSQ